MTEYTPEQKAVVEEILRTKHTEYYRVLKVDKNASDIEIKKSYRKLAIKLHPDKNKHPKASEAFKVIAKAFEVLSDNSKRKMYDMTGTDPDARGGMGGASAAGRAGPGMNGFSGFQGFQGFPQNGGATPDDIFNMFFGGGPGNGFAFNFGGPSFGNNGFYYSNNAGMNARRRAAQQQQNRQRQGNNSNTQRDWTNYLTQFIPIIIILLSLFLNSLGGSNDDSSRRYHEFSGSVPQYSYQPTTKYNVHRNTPVNKIDYYITETTLKDFQGRANAEKELNGLDKFVEKVYIHQLKDACQAEKIQQQRIIDNAQGLFFNDWDAIKRAENMNLKNCKRLEELNYVLL